MGLDSNLYVPAEVRLRDFVDVLSILLGAEVALEPLPQARGAHHAVVKNGLKYRATSIPEMLVIEGVIDGH